MLKISTFFLAIILEMTSFDVLSLVNYTYRFISITFWFTKNGHYTVATRHVLLAGLKISQQCHLSWGSTWGPAVRVYSPHQTSQLDLGGRFEAGSYEEDKGGKGKAKEGNGSRKTGKLERGGLKGKVRASGR